MVRFGWKRGREVRLHTEEGDAWWACCAKLFSVLDEVLVAGHEALHVFEQFARLGAHLRPGAVETVDRACGQAGD